jgi:hypothetical protein
MAVLIAEVKTRPMDIRQNVTRRLMAIVAERRRLESRMSVLTEVEKELRAILEDEPQGTLLQPESSQSTTLTEQLNQNARLKNFIVAQLRSGPKMLNQLVDAAHRNGFDFGEKSALRVLHFNLLNLKNAGTVEKEGEAWRLAEKD